MLDALTFSNKTSNMGMLFSNFAHEVTQPLGAMRLMIESILEVKSMTPSEKQSALRRILTETDRTIDMVRNTRQFFQGARTSSQNIKLAELIQKVLLDLQSVLITHNISVSLNLQELIDHNITVHS